MIKLTKTTPLGHISEIYAPPLHKALLDFFPASNNVALLKALAPYPVKIENVRAYRVVKTDPWTDQAALSSLREKLNANPNARIHTKFVEKLDLFDAGLVEASSGNFEFVAKCKKPKVYWQPCSTDISSVILRPVIRSAVQLKFSHDELPTIEPIFPVPIDYEKHSRLWIETPTRLIRFDQTISDILNGQ